MSSLFTGRSVIRRYLHHLDIPRFLFRWSMLCVTTVAVAGDSIDKSAILSIYTWGIHVMYVYLAMVLGVMGGVREIVVNWS